MAELAKLSMNQMAKYVPYTYTFLYLKANKTGLQNQSTLRHCFATKLPKWMENANFDLTSK